MRAAIILLLTAVLGVGAWYISQQRRQANPNSSTVTATDTELGPLTTHDQHDVATIRCQGKLEPGSGLIRIVAPVGSRVSKLIDKPIGDTVSVGEVLATLQSRELRGKDLQLAKSRRADAINKANFEKKQGEFKQNSAELALAETIAAAEKISAEEQKIGLLRRQRDARQALLNRLQRISSDPTTNDLLNDTDIEKQQLMVEQLNLQIEQAVLEVHLARKSSKRAQKVAKNNLNTVENSLQSADQAIPLTTLDATVELAQQAYDMTEIKSPIDGTILDIIVREGDSVTNQPVMVIGNTTTMNCVAEVSDQFLRLIDLSGLEPIRATVTSAALPQPLTGTVVNKGVMVGPPSLADPNPFAKVDRRTASVTIQLDDSSAAAQLVNSQVDVEIRLPASNETR